MKIVPPHATVLAGTDVRLPSHGVFSPNGRHVAYITIYRGGKQTVSVNGVEGKKYDRIRALEMLATGEAVYLGLLDNRERLVRGVTEMSLDGQVKSYHLSPDRRRMAVVLEIGLHRTRVVVDGVSQAVYENLMDAPIFSPDSRHVAYRAHREGSVYLVRDGVELRHDRSSITVREGNSMRVANNPDLAGAMMFTPQDELRTDLPRGAIFSADGQHVALVRERFPSDASTLENASLGWKPVPAARYGKHVPHAYELLVNNWPVARHEFISQMSFTAQGEPTYIARVAPVYNIPMWDRLIDRLSGTPSPGGFFHDARYLPEKQRDQVRHELFVGGQRHATYPWIVDYRVSDDGRHVALVAANEPWRHVAKPAEVFVVADGKPHSVYDEISCLAFDARNRPFYVAKSGGRFIVFDGVAGRPYDHVECPRIAADGQHIEYGAQLGGKYLWVRDPLTAIAPLSLDDLAGTYIGVLDGMSSNGGAAVERFWQQLDAEAKRQQRVLRLDADSGFDLEIRDQQKQASPLRVTGKFVIDGFRIRLHPQAPTPNADAAFLRRYAGSVLTWQEDLRALITSVVLSVPGAASNEQLSVQERYVRTGDR